jgi:hypothetical protein
MMDSVGIATAAAVTTAAQTRSSMLAAMIKMNLEAAGTLVAILDGAADASRAMTDAAVGKTVDRLA